MHTIDDWKFLILALAAPVTGLVAIATAITLSGRLESRIDRVADDMKQFYMMLGKHDGRLDAIERGGK